jgi:uncharacterized protein (DUF1778 family)
MPAAANKWRAGLRSTYKRRTVKDRPHCPTILLMPRPLSRAASTRSGRSRTPSVRSARFEARLTAEQKTRFSAAAELFGESISQFVLHAADVRARQALLDERMVRLSEADRRAMVAALSHPPKPARRLRKAFERYQDRFGG